MRTSLCAPVSRGLSPNEVGRDQCQFFSTFNQDTPMGVAFTDMNHLAGESLLSRGWKAIIGTSPGSRVVLGPTAGYEVNSPPAEFDDFGPVSRHPVPRIQQIVARRLHAAWTQIPHVTHHEEADVTALMNEREECPTDSKIGLLARVARGCVLALAKFPNFCASLDSSGAVLTVKQYINLGLAIDTPHGLMVGVVPRVTGQSALDLGRRFADLAARARAGTLKPSEMEGSCFTLSNLGRWGGTGFTPIINPPNVAILGTGQARLRPTWKDGAVVPRWILPLCLSYDHRVINGAEAGRFCAFLRDTLADPERCS